MANTMSQYANRDWVKAEVDSLKEGVKDSKAIGIEARRLASKPHMCDKKEELDSLREEQLRIIEELGHWRFFKKLFFVVIGLFVTVTITAATAVVSFAISVKESTGNIENSVNSLNTRQSDLVRRVDDLTSQTPLDQQKQLEDIQKVIESTFTQFIKEEEVKVEKKKKGKR